MPEYRITPGAFADVKPGDTLTRCMSGEIFIPVKVTDVEEGIIYVGKPDGWRFDQVTGMEIDEELGYGPQFGITGSYLLDDRKE
jgi:hypothetical protein